MERKKRRDQGARPPGARCSQQKPVHKQRVCNMNQCVNQQMATAVHGEELAVDHVCNPCEWVPVSRMKGGQRPCEPRERNATVHHRVFLDVQIIIESDELMSDHLRINSKCDDCQADQNKQIKSSECYYVAKQHCASPCARGR